MYLYASGILNPLRFYLPPSEFIVRPDAYVLPASQHTYHFPLIFYLHRDVNIVDQCGILWNVCMVQVSLDYIITERELR